MKIGIEKCTCGHKACQDYWLTGVGHFVQGSGFTKAEAEAIAHALNDTLHRESFEESDELAEIAYNAGNGF